MKTVNQRPPGLCKKLFLKNSTTQPSGTITFLSLAHVSLEVFSLFTFSLSSINSLAMGKPSVSSLPPHQEPSSTGGVSILYTANVLVP